MEGNDGYEQRLDETASNHILSNQLKKLNATRR